MYCRYNTLCARPVRNLVLATVIVLWSAVAAAQCRVQANSWDEEFGSLPLGEVIKSERARTLKACASAAQCAFVDDTGIEYYADEKSILVSKGVEDTAALDRLPFGLLHNDGIEQVKRKLFSSPGVIEVSRQEPDGGIIMSGPCFANSKDVIFSVIVAFGADRQIAGVAMATKEQHQKGRELFEMFERLFKKAPK